MLTTEAPEAPIASQTLHRGLVLLDLVGRSVDPMTLGDLSQTTGWHRSVVYRLLRTLTAHGLVAHVADGYVLGAGALSLARRAAPAMQRLARPELARLSSATGHTAFLAVRDGDDAVTLCSVEVESPASRRVYAPVDRHPLTRGAPGLAILSFEPDAPGRRPELARVRRDGFAVTFSEVLPRIGSLAAPVLDSESRAIGAVAVAFGAEPPRRSIAEEVVRAARALSACVRRAESTGVELVSFASRPVAASVV